MTQGPVLIVGAGHAGFQVAASLRQHGFGGRIALINDEAHLPYQRPPLSKAYLKGTGGPDSLMFRPDKFYRDQNIELITDRAIAIDRGARKLDLAFAATQRIKGLEVDVVELASRVMARAVTAEVSEYFQGRHRAAGIRIHLGVQVTGIEADGGKVTGVSFSDGRHIAADLVVVGVGVLPNVELAADAGLPVASGIIVNEQLLTADPNISAIGDCALFESPRFGGSLRLESVQNATDHARC